MFRLTLSATGFLLVIPLLALILLAFGLPVTVSGVAYLVGATILVGGLLFAPPIKRYYIPIASGIVIIILVGLIRFILILNNNSNLNVLALPGEKRTSWLNSIVDEQDALLFGETLFHFIGGDSNNEHAGLSTAFESVYTEMQNDGNFPSPVVSTYLGLQRPQRFDAVIIEPETQPSFGVVFLHGYMGNVTAQCWVIAQAVQKLGGVTICPSTIWTGEWWRPEGQLILQSSFHSLRERGITSIYLGGFSNGGFSIGRLAHQLENETGLSGLIFIDGFMNGDDVREMGLPVLIIEGTQDERVPVEAARQFATEVGGLGTYIEINSDHFLIMKEPGAIQHAIATWLGHNTSP